MLVICSVNKDKHRIRIQIHGSDSLWSWLQFWRLFRSLRLQIRFLPLFLLLFRHDVDVDIVIAADIFFFLLYCWTESMSDYRRSIFYTFLCVVLALKQSIFLSPSLHTDTHKFDLSVFFLDSFIVWRAFLITIHSAHCGVCRFFLHSHSFSHFNVVSFLCGAVLTRFMTIVSKFTFYCDARSKWIEIED